MDNLDSIRQRREVALAMAYGYFLGNGSSEEDSIQTALTYAHTGLNQRERDEIVLLIEKDVEARKYYLTRFKFSTTILEI